MVLGLGFRFSLFSVEGFLPKSQASIATPFIFHIRLNQDSVSIAIPSSLEPKPSTSTV